MGATMVLLATIFNACKKYDNPPPIYEEYGGSMDAKGERRILVINLDGAVGAEVKKINPVTIAGMLKTSKYSFSAASDVKTNNGSTWVSMMSGVTSSKHGIVDDQFNRASGGNDHEEVKNYPSVLARMLDVRPEFKVVTLTSNTELNKYLVHADRRILTSNDIAIKDSLIKVLQTESPKAIIADFKDVETAGVNFGFSADVPEYKAAIVKTDAYIGEVMDALKKRKDFAKEDWLVVLTSNHGGVGKAYGGNSAPERNIFSIFYNPSFKPLEMNVTPYYAVRLYGKGDDAAVVAAGGVVRATADDPSGIYNPGNGSMTIEAKVLFNKNANGDYSYNVPPFLSKTNNRTGNTAGWSFFRNGNGVTFFVANGATNVQPLSSNVGTDGKWHTLTGTIARVGTDYKINVYVDGLKSTEETTLSGGTSIISPSPVVMGYQPSVFLGGYVDMYMGDVKIWNKALSAEVIKQNVEVTSVPVTDPNYPNLVGFWPANDGASSQFKNKAGVTNAPNFNLTGKYSWDLLAANPATGYGPADPNTVLLQNLDVATQMLYWLRVPTKSSWNLDGTLWLSKYEIEFIKP